MTFHSFLISIEHLQYPAFLGYKKLSQKCKLLEFICIFLLCTSRLNQTLLLLHYSTHTTQSDVIVLKNYICTKDNVGLESIDRDDFNLTFFRISAKDPKSKREKI